MTFAEQPGDGPADGAAMTAALRARAPRATTMLLVARMTGARHDILCRISNISSGGLRAVGPDGAFAVGEPLTVEIRHAHHLAGHVVWVKGGAFGLRFAETIDVEAFLATLSSAQPVLDGLHVRPPRLPTACKVELRAWGRIHRPIMTDLSQKGARLTLSSPVLEPETPIVLSIRGLTPLRAMVRWVQDDQCGITFLETVAFSRLSTWLMDPALRYSAGS